MKQSMILDNWPILASYFEREGIPVGETEMTVHINGVYSLPEEWIRLDGCGAVDNWSWSTKISDILFTEGKINPRELTEDEKKEAESKNKKKVEPPKKGKVDDNQLQQAELEKLEKERIEKEERDKKYQEEWNALDEKGRFYKKKETPTEESWLTYLKFTNSIIKTGERLVDLEDEINGSKGTFIEFTKLPPPDEDPKKRPKPKNINIDEIKPIHCVGWVDLNDFHLNPGLKEVSLRVPLMLKETYEKKLSLDEEKKVEGQVNFLNNSESQIVLPEELSDYVLAKKTYIYLKINFSVPINPPNPEKSLPDPADLIKRENKTFKQITPDEIASDFRKQLKIAIEAIAKEYVNFMGDAKNNLIKKEKTNVLSNVRKEERDSNITKFLYHFNISGKAELLKEKLKRYLVRIVREIYKKKTNIIGVFKDEKDQFYSQLFAYATDEVKLAMDEYVFLKKDELHEHIISSYDQSRKEVMQYAIKLYKEPEEKKLLRLSTEYEIINDLNKSLYYYKCRLTLNKNKESWSSYAILSKKLGNLIEVEESIVNCIELEPEDINLKLLYSSIKWLKGRGNDAIYYLNNIIQKSGLKSTNCGFNAFLAMLYKDRSKDLLFQKHLETAKRFKMRELNMLPPVGSKKVSFQKIKQDLKKPVLPDDQFDAIFYSLCNFFNEFYFFEVSEKLLEFIINKSSIKYLIEQAKILSFKKDYDPVINFCDEILSKEKTNYIAWILRGNAFFFKNNIFDSEESYVKAIRCKPDRAERFDVKMLYRLGLVYVRRKTWADAKTVFLQILKESTSYGFAWRYLGLSYMRLGEYSLAEEALNEANLLDVDNSYNWAYLTIFCILVNRKYQAYECLNELNKTKFDNTELWEEIADSFEKIGEYQIAADIYNKIIKFDSKSINVYIKLSKLYFYQFDSKRKESLEILKNCLKYAEDEKDKKRIAESIDQINNQINMQDSHFLDKSLEKNMNTDQTDFFGELNNNNNLEEN